MHATFVALVLRSLRGRILLLLAFAAAFLGVAATLRSVAGHEGHVEPQRLFELGGYPLVSGLLLAGWLLSRFPLIAALVLFSGFFSRDRDSGVARLLAARPGSLLRVYAPRFAVLAGSAFTLGALLLPAFDFILLGRWAGPATLLLVAAYVIVFAGLTAFLSLWTRADAWIAGLLAVLAIAWHALRASGAVEAAPWLTRDLVSMLLPPHGALAQLETAFAQLEPVPWIALLYVMAYGMIWILLAAMLLGSREI